MGGQPVRLGPFIGGLNTLSDASSVDDAELVDCVNFELDLDGSLVSRPPVTAYAVGPVANTPFKLLGYVKLESAYYLIASTSTGTYAWNGSAWSTITTTFGASCVVQYGASTKAWLVNPTGAGGSWTPSGGFVSVPSMPKGAAAVVQKERMYIAPGLGNGSRIQFSALADPSSWNVGDFFDVGSGDGEDVLDLTVFNDNIFIFKQNSTYIMAFDSTPADGIVRKVSATIGVSGQNCQVIYEQQLYIFHEGNIYEVTNYDFSRINTKVPFTYDPSGPGTYVQEAFLCLFGDRLLVRYFGRIYVFGLRTRTWTRWSSNLYFGNLVAVPNSSNAQLTIQYLGGSIISGQGTLHKMETLYNATDSEQFTCTALTKNYDLAISYRFKRLFWWGADVSAAQSITGKVTPVVYSFASTWGDLSTLQWGALTFWGQPTATPSVVSTAIATSGSGAMRRFIKFLKGIRFRQVYFEIDLNTGGTTATGPVRLFNITAIVDTKEKAVGQIS